MGLLPGDRDCHETEPAGLLRSSVKDCGRSGCYSTADRGCGKSLLLTGLGYFLYSKGRHLLPEQESIAMLARSQRASGCKINLHLNFRAVGEPLT